jgi:hypothetical protein
MSLVKHAAGIITLLTFTVIKAKNQFSMRHTVEITPRIWNHLKFLFIQTTKKNSKFDLPFVKAPQTLLQTATTICQWNRET